MNKNPFIFGKPVGKGDFYNRREEIEAAIGFIKRLQSFSVIGERRIGKTSFLKNILSREVLQAYGIDIETHVVACLGLSSFHKISKESLISTIAKRIAEQTHIETNSANIFDEFKTCIKNLASNGKNLIIALDEFEVIAPILVDNFSHWLRFIFQEENVVAITASQTTVRELEISGGAASPLFNIFGNIFLGLFGRSETENMILEMFQKGGIGLEEEENTFLADLSGGNPYLIQLLGYYGYEEKKRSRGIIPEKFKESMVFHTNDQFESCWRHLTKDEKKFLVHAEKSKNNQISNILERKGIICVKKGKIEIFSPLFRKFIDIKVKTDRDLLFV